MILGLREVKGFDKSDFRDVFLLSLFYILIIINSGGIEWNCLKSQKSYWLLKKRNH